MNNLFIPKEISWLSFNERVLQEAADKSNTLPQRIKFLGIYSNNLDEFFRVRIASVKRLAFLGKKAVGILQYDPAMILRQIQEIVIRQQSVFNSTYKEIVAELSKHDIIFINESQLTNGQKTFVKNYFINNVRLHIMPVMLDDIDVMPPLEDDGVYLAVCLKINREKSKKNIYSLVKIPSNVLGRFVLLPSYGGKKHIIFLDDVIRFGLNYIFYMFSPSEINAYTIKVTRDADFDIADDISESYINKVVKGLQKRKEGEPSRFIYDRNMPANLLKLLLNKINIKQNDTIIPGERYHNFKDLLKLSDILLDKFGSMPVLNLQHPYIQPEKSIINSIFKNDVLLYFPCHSFNYFIDLLREASIDSKVKSIKITLYRLALFSNVVNALINAARNGKKVTALLEIQARFDEEANIRYGNSLREEGVNVLYGVPGLKVHAKLCLIEYSSKKEQSSIACIGNGNFNENTAKVYIDGMLLTSDKRITNEVNKIFNFLKITYKTEQFFHLAVSPFNSRQKIVKLITNEIANARKGMPAYIHLKLNNLVDEEIIRLLYRASNEGVEIKLNVRGMFSMLPEKYTNIQAIGIVDNLLEHSRIFIFCNNGDEKCFLSSADLMTRNLDRRIEVICPLYDKKIKKQARLIFDTSWNENIKARILDNNLSNKYKIRNTAKPGFRSQIELYKVLNEFQNSELND